MPQGTWLNIKAVQLLLFRLAPPSHKPPRAGRLTLSSMLYLVSVVEERYTR